MKTVSIGYEKAFVNVSKCGRYANEIEVVRR